MYGYLHSHEKMLLKKVLKMDTTHDITKWAPLYKKSMWEYAREQVWIKKTKKYAKKLTGVSPGMITWKLINVLLS